MSQRATRNSGAGGLWMWRCHLEHGSVALVVILHLLFRSLLALDAGIVRLINPGGRCALLWVVHKGTTGLRVTWAPLAVVEHPFGCDRLPEDLLCLLCLPVYGFKLLRPLAEALVAVLRHVVKLLVVVLSLDGGDGIPVQVLGSARCHNPGERQGRRGLGRGRVVVAICTRSSAPVV